MKKINLVMATALFIGVASCSSKSPKNVESTDSTAVSTVKVDSNFVKAAAGDYLSYDLKRTVTLKEDGTVTSKGFQTEYTSWELASQPADSMAEIKILRKGLDAEVKDAGAIDLKDGRLLIKDETFRKQAKKK